MSTTKDYFREDIPDHSNDHFNGGRPACEAPAINLCQRHYDAADWSDMDVQITSRQSCDICKEKH